MSEKKQEKPLVDYKGIETTGGRGIVEKNLAKIDYALRDLPAQQRAIIIAQIIEESGGDPMAKSANGTYQGLLQWGKDRYTIKSKDPVKELDNQIKYLRSTMGNTTDGKSWTHGGKGSGYKSLKEAYGTFSNPDAAFDDSFRAFSYGYVRPYGKEASYNNRLKVGHQVYDRILQAETAPDTNLPPVIMQPDATMVVKPIVPIPTQEPIDLNLLHTKAEGGHLFNGGGYTAKDAASGNTYYGVQEFADTEDLHINPDGTVTTRNGSTGAIVVPQVEVIGEKPYGLNSGSYAPVSLQDLVATITPGNTPSGEYQESSLKRNARELFKGILDWATPEDSYFNATRPYNYNIDVKNTGYLNGGARNNTVNIHNDVSGTRDRLEMLGMVKDENGYYHYKNPNYDPNTSELEQELFPLAEYIGVEEDSVRKYLKWCAENSNLVNRSLGRPTQGDAWTRHGVYGDSAIVVNPDTDKRNYLTKAIGKYSLNRANADYVEKNIDNAQLHTGDIVDISHGGSSYTNTAWDEGDYNRANSHTGTVIKTGPKKEDTYILHLTENGMEMQPIGPMIGKGWYKPNYITAIRRPGSKEHPYTKAEGGYLDTPWNELPISMRAEIMREAVNNGIYNLQDVRDAYHNNLFGGGGYTPSKTIKQRIAEWEGTSMYKAAPDTGKVNRSFEAEAKDFN